MWHSFALYTFLALLSLEVAIADSDIKNGVIADNIKSAGTEGANTHTGTTSDANIKNIEDSDIITGITEDEWIGSDQELQAESGSRRTDPSPHSDPKDCLMCTNPDTATKRMNKKKYSCLHPNVQAQLKKKCSAGTANKKWGAGKYCEQRCFEIGAGADKPCCFSTNVQIPTPPPTPPTPTCRVCTDNATPRMKRQSPSWECPSKDEDVVKLLLKKCSANRGWTKKKYCEKSCEQSGMGYEETPCCADPERPNVLLILADDVGMGDISCYNSDATDNEGQPLTPNIDALQKSGTYFTDFHSMPLCAPSRRTLLSGRYPPGEVWSLKAGQSSLKSNEQSLPQLLQGAGYNTAFFGKFHLGGKIPPNGMIKGRQSGKYLNQTEHHWDQRLQLAARYLGFSTSYMAAGGIQDPPYAFFENDLLDVNHDDAMSWKRDVVNFDHDDTWGHSGEGLRSWDSRNFGGTMIEKTQTFLNAHAENNAENKQPFFIYFASEAVHVPHTPPDFFTVNDVQEAVANTTRSVHLDMVKNLDLQVGALIGELDKRGLRDNTVVMFVSDNGGLGAYDGGPNNCMYGTEDHDVSLGRRDCKGSVYEGGHRVPAIVSWPGHVQEGQDEQEGHELADLTCISDVFRTVAEMAGIPVSRDQAPDSTSFLPRIRVNSPAETPVRHSLYVQRSGRLGGTMIRYGNLKMIRILDIDSHFGLDAISESLCTYELYDLESDPSESDNILSKFTDHDDDVKLIKEMAAGMDRFPLNKVPQQTFKEALKKCSAEFA